MICARVPGISMHVMLTSLKVLPNVTALKGIELFGMHGKMLQKKRLGK